MSSKSKGISVDKIIAQFEKVDWDEKLKAYNKIKEFMQFEATKRSEEHQEKASYYATIGDKL